MQDTEGRLCELGSWKFLASSTNAPAIVTEHWAYRLRWLVSLASLSFVACDNASLPPLPPIETTSDQRVVDQLGAYLHEVEETGYSGIVGVELGDAPPLVFGLGNADQEADRDFTARTLVPIGSLTKGVLGVMMAGLSVDGRVDLQQPLSELLPAGWPLADKADLTLHELLTHQSGLPESLGADDEPIEREEFWALAMAAPLSERGIYRYSNVGYSVAMIALEAATDTPHEEFLTGQLTDTGIASIAYRLDGPELATGYDGSRRWGTIRELPQLADGAAGWHLRGSGGLLATVPDMFRWRRWVESQPDVTDLTFAPHVEQGGGLAYGYGWDIGETSRRTTVVNHDGGNGVFYARVTWWPEENAFLFSASNRSTQPAEELHSRLVSAVIARLNH